MLGAEHAYRRRRKARETLVTPTGPHPGDGPGGGHLWVGGEWTPATGNLVQVPALPLRNMGPEQATFPLWSPVPSTGKKGGLRGSPQ